MAGVGVIQQQPAAQPDDCIHRRTVVEARFCNGDQGEVGRLSACASARPEGACLLVLALVACGTDGCRESAGDERGTHHDQAAVPGSKSDLKSAPQQKYKTDHDPEDGVRPHRVEHPDRNACEHGPILIHAPKTDEPRQLARVLTGQQVSVRADDRIDLALTA